MRGGASFGSTRGVGKAANPTPRFAGDSGRRDAQAENSAVNASAPMRSSTVEVVRKPLRRHLLARRRSQTDSRKAFAWCSSTPLREAQRSIMRSASAASGSPADSFSTRGRTVTFRSKRSSRRITPSSTPACSRSRSSSPRSCCATAASVTHGSNAVPRAYRLALLGIPIFVLGGIGDMLWHRLLGNRGGRRCAAEPNASDSRIGHLLSVERTDSLGSLPTVAAPRRSRVSYRSRLGLRRG